MPFKRTLSNDMGEGRKVVTRKKKLEGENVCRIKIFGIADMYFGLGDTNTYTPDAVDVYIYHL